MKPLKFTILLLAIFIISCSQNSENSTTIIVEKSPTPTITKKKIITKTDIENLGITLKANEAISYNTIKENIKKTRQSIDPKNISQDSLSKLFTELLVNQIIPYWYDTPWDFNGYTATPQKGTIACGYFVSTTLEHMGIRVNRYKLAQQSPINEAKTLTLNAPIINIAYDSATESVQELKTKFNKVMKEGIYFIGFSASHVGYVLKKNDELFLIHSNYMGNTKVEIEPVELSDVFSGFDSYYLVELSTNKAFLEKWVSQESIKVHFGE